MRERLVFATKIFALPTLLSQMSLMDHVNQFLLDVGVGTPVTLVSSVFLRRYVAGTNNDAYPPHVDGSFVSIIMTLPSADYCEGETTSAHDGMMH